MQIDLLNHKTFLCSCHEYAPLHINVLREFKYWITHYLIESVLKPLARLSVKIEIHPRKKIRKNFMYTHVRHNVCFFKNEFQIRNVMIERRALCKAL